MTSLRTERGIIASWLVKIVIGLAIFAFIAYDAGSILVNVFTLDSAAEDVAIAVSLEVTENLNTHWSDEEIYELAQDIVADPDEGVENARVIENGTNIDDDGVIHVKLRRTADSLIVKRIGAIEDWARATGDGTSGTT